MLHRLNRFEEYLSCTFLALMTIVIIMQVFFRYCLTASLDWPEELGRYLFIASVFMGASYAEQRDKHLSITILRTNGGRFLGKILEPFARIATAAFCLLMVVWGIRMVVFVHSTQQVMPALLQPMWLVYACVPVGMGCMAFRAVINLFRKHESADLPVY